MSTVNPPLMGIRILDLTRNLPGPLATTMLGDLGADVIKLEDPRTGDPVRLLPPHVGNVSAFHLGVNRSKRSLAVDLKQAEGQALALRLAATCDVVVEGFRPGVIDRLGLGWDRLQSARADIILCSITGYGQTGPDRDLPGHDINYCARAGILGQSGRRQDPPAMLGAQFADVAGGSLQAVAAIFGALFQRERTGQGQWLDVAMAEGVLSTMALTMAIQLAGFPAPGRGQGPLTGGLPCYGVYECRDGRHLAVGALEGHFFDALVRALQLPELAGQGLAFGESGETIRAAIQARFLERDAAEWIEALAGVDACVELVLEVPEVLADPQYVDRGMFFQLPGPAGPMGQLASPLRLAGAAPPDRPPPGLGEHTAEILADIGVDATEVRALADQGVILLGDAS